MKPLTWQQLKDAVNELTPEQLAMNVNGFRPSLLPSNSEIFPISETILLSEMPDKYRDFLESHFNDDVPLLVIKGQTRRST